MNLHEYQAKQLFAEYGLLVSRGIAVDSGDEAALCQGHRWRSLGCQSSGSRRRERQGWWCKAIRL